MDMKGSCLCGAVQFTIHAELSSFYFCHCTRCQKSSGSAHSSNLFFKNAELVWDKGANLYNEYHYEGTRFGKRFCKTCACPLPRELESKHQIIQVPAGILDGNQHFEATAHIFMDSKKCWEEQLPSLKRFPGLPSQ